MKNWLLKTFFKKEVEFFAHIHLKNIVSMTYSVKGKTKEQYAMAIGIIVEKIIAEYEESN